MQDTKLSELNADKETDEAVRDLLHQEPEVPLFLRDGAEDQKGDGQDEKDVTAE